MVKVIFGSAGRQLFSGVINIFIGVYSTSSINSQSLAEFNSLYVLAIIISTIIGIGFYTTLYDISTEKNEDMALSFLFSLLIFCFLIGSLVYYCGFLVNYAFNLNINYKFLSLMICFLVVANAVPAFLLGFEKYSEYNIVEVLQPFSYALIVSILFSIGSVDKNIVLYYALGVSFFLKIAVFFLWLLITRRKKVNIKIFDKSLLQYFGNGFKVGYSGAYQSSIFRGVFFFLISMPGGGMISIIWPVLEKTLVIAQASNAIMYGLIKKSKLSEKKIMQIYVILLISIFCASIGGYLFVGVWEVYFANGSYVGMSSYSMTCVLIICMQSIRIMAYNYMAAFGAIKISIYDSTIILVVMGAIYLVKFFGINSDTCLTFFIAAFFVISCRAVFFAARIFNEKH